ncbi:ESCO1/2 acetyl-transferase-domain-containing protein [Hyaloraphidium curvatum]|nr:ESCO1/2 acetyl-transferase-domain-containing protein [Hyaloraphidium curvatum]
MSYNVGQADDEGVHKKFHRAVVAGIDFPVLPGEQVVRSFEAAVGGARGTFKILLITGESSKREQKLASEVVEIANQELGAVSLSDQLPSLKTFVCVSADRKAAGCVVAEPIAEGFELLPSSTGSLDGGEGDGACRMGSGDTSLLYRPEPRPAVCGISRIWVSKGHRRYGFGLQLLEAVRSRFIFGCSLSPAQIAFSQPTTAGRRLAERFCGRANFLVYVEQ